MMPVELGGVPETLLWTLFSCGCSALSGSTPATGAASAA
jgi:hypothetical protein